MNYHNMLSDVNKKLVDSITKLEYYNTISREKISEYLYWLELNAFQIYVDVDYTNI